MDDLSETQWTARVLTAQGRDLPATEIPWLRSREMWVHTVDLGVAVGFTALPADFLAALCDDIVHKRGGATGPGSGVVLAPVDTATRWHLPSAPREGVEPDTVTVVGLLADIAAYLTGRKNRVTTTDGRAAPALSAWL